MTDEQIFQILKPIADDEILLRDAAGVIETGRALLSASIADTANEMAHDAWKPAFDERHEFDVYPEHFMSGMRNEFAAGWHAALKAIAKEPK